MSKARPRTARPCLLALVLALATAVLLAAAALAAEQTDRSFGDGGVSKVLPSALARQLGVGPVVFDLARDRDGRIVAAVSDYSGQGGYMAAARFLPGGALDSVR
jgi:hypothetical protein